jgi:hypothetical protein
LDRKRCPCDFHFPEYLTKRGVGSKSIFHFGSGEHHLLGRANVVGPKRNEILAITASKSEHAAYVELIIRNPEIAKYYKRGHRRNQTGFAIWPRSSRSTMMVTIRHSIFHFS